MLRVLSLITIAQTVTVLRQVEFNASQINAHITSVNVGKFLVWALCDTQLMRICVFNILLSESMFFLIIQDLRAKFTTKRVTQVLFLL